MELARKLHDIAYDENFPLETRLAAAQDLHRIYTGRKYTKPIDEKKRMPEKLETEQNGIRLRQFRKMHGLTQRQVAERMGKGVHNGDISRLETGKLEIGYWLPLIRKIFPEF